VCGLLADLHHAFEKEGHPALPVAGIAHGLQPLVVLAAVLLEIVRKVEHGF
jgi:hypothetical protein